MRNPPQPYKHAGENDMNYSKTADSSLLAKRRQNFAIGGAAYPIQGASGSARWQGAGPDSWAAMRAEMSPGDIATFQKQVSPAEFQAFMGAGTQAAPAGPQLNYTPPAATARELPARPAFNPQALTRTAARSPELPPQADSGQATFTPTAGGNKGPPV